MLICNLCADNYTVLDFVFICLKLEYIWRNDDKDRVKKLTTFDVEEIK